MGIFPDDIPGVVKLKDLEAVREARAAFHRVFESYSDPRIGPVMLPGIAFARTDFDEDGGLIPEAVYDALVSEAKARGETHFYMCLAEGGDPFSPPHEEELFALHMVTYETYTSFHFGAVICLYWSSSGAWGLFGDGDDWKVTLFKRVE